MATEPFLVNPPKRLRRRMNPLSGTLVTIGANPMRRRRRNPENPWFGDPGGHRIAALMRWGKIRRGSVKRYRRRGRPSVSSVVRVIRRKRVGTRTRRRVRRYSPRHMKMVRKMRKTLLSRTQRRLKGYRTYGFMLAHPRSKRRMNPMARRRKRNTWFGQPRRHRKAAFKGWRKGHRIGRRRVKHYRRNYFTNPGATVASNPRRRRRSGARRRHRRSYRRNPAGINFGRLTSGLTNVRSWAPLAITGGLSAITGAVVPQMVLQPMGIVNPFAKLGAQLVTAVAGGMIVERAVDKRHGEAWMIVGVAMVGYQLLKQFLLVPYFPQFAVGLGEYNDYVLRDVSQEVGAFPTAISAYPNEMSAYPGVGADEEMVGSYPYDGTGY